MFAVALVLALLVPAAGPAAAPSAATVPTAPRSLAGTAGPPVARATLTWLAPTDLGGGLTTYVYDVATNYDSVAKTGTWSAPASLKRTTTVAQVPCAAVFPAVCTYRLYARNTAGTSGPSAPFTVAWSAPSNARSLSAQAPNFSDASLKWGTAANTGGLVNRYNVEVSNDNGVTWSVLATSIATRTFTAPGSCTNGTVCKYRVWARNPAGISTVPSNVVLVNVAPARVGTFIVNHTADDVTTSNATSGNATMAISWTTPAKGLFNGPYQLQECSTECSPNSLNWGELQPIPNGTLNTTRTCPAGATTCSYRVRATNVRGGVSPFATMKYVPVAPVLTSVQNGTTSGTVRATFGPILGTGPAANTARFRFWACRTGCSTAANWALSPTTVKYPPSQVPTLAAVECPVAGASCSVRVQFINDAGKTSMLSAAGTAFAPS